MTFDDLTDQCWAALPPIRKRLVGKEGVRRMLEDAIREWDNEALCACEDGVDLQLYQDALVERVRAKRAQQQEYGFVLMSILLTAVLVAVVQWLVKWWLDRNFNRVMLAGWQREMAL